MSTLLEKAIAVKPTRRTKPASHDLEDLAIAWARGKITTGQATTALGLRGGYRFYGAMAIGLRSAMANGRLRVVEKE